MANRRMLEKEIEKLFWVNMENYEPCCERIGQQIHFTWSTSHYLRRKIIIDVLLRDKTTSAFVIVEVKAIKARIWTYNNQIVEYAKRAAFKKWRGIIVTPDFEKRLMVFAENTANKLKLIKLGEVGGQ